MDVIINPWCDQNFMYNTIEKVLCASYQIRKIAGCACLGDAGNVFPSCRFQGKLLVSDPGMHHDRYVTQVPWCMSGSLTCGDGENVPGIPGACAPAIFSYLASGPWGQLRFIICVNPAQVYLLALSSVIKQPLIDNILGATTTQSV